VRRCSQAAHITAGAAAAEAGDSAAALVSFGNGLAFAAARGDAPGIVLAMESIASAHVEAGRADEAAATYADMIAAADAAGLRHKAAVGRAAAARLTATNGRCAEAAWDFAAAARVTDRPGVAASYADEAETATGLVTMDAEAAAGEARLVATGGSAAVTQDAPPPATEQAAAAHRRLGELYGHLRRPRRAVAHLRADSRSLSADWADLPPRSRLDAPAAAAAAALAECLEAVGDRRGAAAVAGAELRVRVRLGTGTAATAVVWGKLGKFP